MRSWKGSDSESRLRPTSHAPLLDWFAAQKRDLPWRRTRDPYTVWVSEIMLQQTQVATVIPYFERWMARFPTVQDLAKAEEQEVLSLWQGLGYYRRCRLLLAGARWVAEHGLPQTADEWLAVPGVGRYTAGAIASIALGEPAALVDGNVERVFARFEGSDLSGPSLSRHAWMWAESVVPSDRSGDWNQALMELGATVCRPRSTSCDQCPLQTECIAFATRRQLELPVPAKREATVPLIHSALAQTCRGRFGLEQIPSGLWWEGMWRFPALEGTGDPVGIVRHAVTKHRITLQVWHAEVSDELPALSWFTLAELKHLPMPSPQRKALKLVLDALR